MSYIFKPWFCAAGVSTAELAKGMCHFTTLSHGRCNSVLFTLHKKKIQGKYHLSLWTDLLFHKPQKWQVECALKLLQTNQVKLILPTLPLHPPSPKTRMETAFHSMWVICISMGNRQRQKERVYLWEIHTEDWIFKKMLVSVTLLLGDKGVYSEV